MHRLSKSKVLSGKQCLKRLWLEVNKPELAEAGENDLVFQTGHQVGELAKQAYPSGLQIEQVFNVTKALDDTQAAIQSGQTVLFEPAFLHENVLIRADIWQRLNHQISVSEVKSASRVKDVHLEDVAVQQWVMTGVGMPADTLYLTCIDTEFVYQGNQDYDGLFKHIDITEAVSGMQSDVSTWVSLCQDTLAGKEPAIPPGDQCTTPYDCPFYDVCNTEEEGYPVEILTRRGNLARDLREQGYTDVREVPKGLLKNDQQIRIWQATRTGQPIFTTEGQAILSGLVYPRYYLDFETIGFAIPIWVGTRPYEALPFQWSCHIESADGSLAHEGFLDVSGDAPMRDFIEGLINTLGTHGPIIVYSNYEKTQLTALAKRYPDLADDIKAIIDRLFDLLPFVRNHYYHPDQNGSFSIKNVLPTLVDDLSYKDLAVRDGMMAQVAYLEAIDNETGDERREVLHQSLWEYCRLDTMAMVQVVSKLNSMKTNV